MQCFDSRISASTEAANLIENRLRARLMGHDRASLMVSGGGTPLLCFQSLSNTDIDWSSVDVTLTDEREVPADHHDSNERMIREQLLVAKARCGNFIPLNRELTTRLLPFTCTLVGMGEDGHFASLFPDSPQLQQGLTSDAETISVTTPSSPYARISHTLKSICDSELIILLIFGSAKREIALAPDGYPVYHLLSQSKTPVITLWAP